ncbi:MAG: ribonuclease III domain-containing protein [Candidatus Onthomonas sp.]|nr:ribonuclease III domain-containing protein [Candidatus Onthomonas sp.]
MKDYFDIQLNPTQLRSMSSLALAHMGDCVYEILVRGWLCSGGLEVNGNLHRETVALVRASAQADALDRITPLLTEEEVGVVHRGRNANIHMIPKGASRGEYRKATALEALFGWLYLQHRTERINELFDTIMSTREEEA